MYSDNVFFNQYKIFAISYQKSIYTVAVLRRTFSFHFYEVTQGAAIGHLGEEHNATINNLFELEQSFLFHIQLINPHKKHPTFSLRDFFRWSTSHKLWHPV